MGASAQGGVQPMGQSQLASAAAAGNTSTNPNNYLGGQIPIGPVTDPSLLMQGGPGVGGGYLHPMGGPNGKPQFGEYGRPMGGFEQPQRNDMSTMQQQNYQGGGDVFSNAAAGLNQAMQGTQQGMNYQPMNINAGQIAGQTMQYMNPYESQVVGQTLGDLNRARQMSQNDIAAQAQRAGAFGGSRQALMASELDRNFMNQAASTAGQLRQAGWTQGQNLASTAAQANQQAGLTGANLRLGAANQMGNLANLGFGMGQQTQEMQQKSGTIAQAINQALIDAAKGQYAGYTGAPAHSLDYMARAIGATPNVSTTTNTRQPGVFDYLTLGATALGGK